MVTECLISLDLLVMTLCCFVFPSFSRTMNLVGTLLAATVHESVQFEPEATEIDDCRKLVVS